jgi:hypothetical protein
MGHVLFVVERIGIGLIIRVERELIFAVVVEMAMAGHS